MIPKPSFFESIRRKAAQRWNQLERDPELAAPWWQLFKQVQSPRHVLSELLQNADDAGATQALVRIEDGALVFEHNGQDFTEEQFESLCRFGYSNKRHLHTIGFRGLGFKSTFSLGEVVKLYTPTLAVLFDRRRFTEPHWLEDKPCTDSRTRIHVLIQDDYRQRELEKNLEEWQRSALSLLFFRHLRSLCIGRKTLKWLRREPGPIPDSEWMALEGDGSQPVLLIRSGAQPFPPEALEEIRKERMLAEDDIADFPPSTVDIVLGVEGPGRLFVVLPTEVETVLPFSCNAPFIQDPARLKIKDPEISPTNRWLLRRVGELAAKSFLTWLEQTDRSRVDRARAYGLFPATGRDDNSIAGVCAALVEEAFDCAISEKKFLFTEEGSLVAAGCCVSLPRTLLEVWSPKKAARVFDPKGRPLLSRHVSAADRRKLLEKNVLEEICERDVLIALQKEYPPRPAKWERLLKLWEFIAPKVVKYWSGIPWESLRIVPVAGENVLYPASRVVRLGEAKRLQSEEDATFLAAHLAVLDPDWLKFLEAQKRDMPGNSSEAVPNSVAAALAVLERLGLQRATDVNTVIDRVARRFLDKGAACREDWIRLAQIAARLKAKVGENFCFVTRDGRTCPARDGVLYDEDGCLEELVPEAQRASLILHSDYVQAFRSCTREEWNAWVASGQAGLLSFPSLVETSRTIWGRQAIEAEVRRRGGKGIKNYPYRSEWFEIVDWDFDGACWNHWEEFARKDKRIWARIGERILEQREWYWKGHESAKIEQIAINRNCRQLDTGPLLTSWVLRLREKPCLRDTRGVCRKPEELFRRTPETEALLGVEVFVDARLDTEAARPLLDLLGVQSKPAEPDRLLERLRALAGSEKPQVHEVDRLYRGLDQIVSACSTSNLEKIRMAFRSEKLILTSQGTWVTVSSVFQQANEDDVPGAPLLRESVSDLMLWHKIGVAERPTPELAISWLEDLPKGQRLAESDLRRVRALLARHAVRVWRECEAWLNLAGEWVERRTLRFALTMQSLVPWKHLDEWVKQQTADLQSLPIDVTGRPPFCELPALAACIEERFQSEPLVRGETEEWLWLTTLGSELRRIQLGDTAETERVRQLAKRLACTRAQRVGNIEVIPYIDGTPAGRPRRTDVLWLGDVLYVVEDLPKAKCAKLVPEEVGKVFDQTDIKAALDYSFGRSPEDVRAYVRENFTLDPAGQAGEDEAPPATTDAVRALDGKPEAGGWSGEMPDMSDDKEPVSQPKAVDGLADGIEDPTATDALASVSRQRTQKPERPDIMERFATGQDFRKEGPATFRHPDGSWIVRDSDDRWRWEWRGASGELVRYYVARAHCLDRAPLEIEAELWWAIEKKPELYVLILEHTNGNPVAIPGVELLRRVQAGAVKIYPASYRLVKAKEPP